MRFAVWLIERPRWFKRAVLIVNDLLLLSLAVWAAYTLRLSRLYVPDALDKWLVMAAAPIIGVAVFHMRGLYKLVTRFIGPEGTTRIYVAVIIATVATANQGADNDSFHPPAAHAEKAAHRMAVGQPAVRHLPPTHM